MLVARDRARLENVSDELTRDVRGRGGDPRRRPVRPGGDVQTVADRLADAGRPVDLLVNNAGLRVAASFLRQRHRRTRRRCSTCSGRAVLVLSHAAARAMRERGHGAIVNVSSVAGFVPPAPTPRPRLVTAFTEGLASELAGTGVTATALLPRVHPHRVPRSAPTSTCPDCPTSCGSRPTRLVRDCLDDVAKGKVVSVPGLQYKVLTGVLQVLPPRARTSRLGHRRVAASPPRLRSAGCFFRVAQRAWMYAEKLCG